MQAKPFDPARLAPDVRAVLEAMNESGAPPLDTLPIAEMREAYKQIGATLGGEVLPVGEVRDIKAMGPAGAIPLRLYVPQTPSSPGAATVYIHGGGWSLGDLDSHDKVCRRLVHNSGVTVVAIGYRLARGACRRVRSGSPAACRCGRQRRGQPCRRRDATTARRGSVSRAGAVLPLR